MARAWSSPGKNAHFALRQIQKLSFLKKVDQLAKLSAYVFHAMFVKSAWNMHSHTMSALEFGADSLNVSAAV
jgi:hypothetical protein